VLRSREAGEPDRIDHQVERYFEHVRPLRTPPDRFGPRHGLLDTGHDQTGRSEVPEVRGQRPVIRLGVRDLRLGHPPRDTDRVFLLIARHLSEDRIPEDLPLDDPMDRRSMSKQGWEIEKTNRPFGRRTRPTSPIVLSASSMSMSDMWATTRSKWPVSNSVRRAAS